MAVLGCGIVGIASALELSRRGFNVKIYSQIIPKYGERDSKKMCTSQVAPGYWLPYYYDFKDKEQHRRRVKIAYESYQGWMKIFKGI